MRRRAKPFRIEERLKSVGHAFAGLKDLFATQHNMWIHALATLLALDFAWWLKVDRNGLALIVVAIAIVWMAEAFNTVLEVMADLLVGERLSKTVRRAKDISAAGVLFAALGAAGIGIAVLGPPLIVRLSPFFT